MTMYVKCLFYLLLVIHYIYKIDGNDLYLLLNIIKDRVVQSAPIASIVPLNAS